MSSKNVRAVSAWETPILRAALADSFRKLDPRTMAKNPVMFVVEVGSLLTTGLWIQALLGQAVDSLTRLEEKFIHVGVLSKQPVTERLSIRLSGGLNYISITQSVTGPQSGEQSVDAEKKIGYFGGIGVEHLFDGGRTSLFGDVVYDYRRIHDVNFNGDYGGLRCVIGVNFILF